jgi:hypothetical protein
MTIDTVNNADTGRIHSPPSDSTEGPAYPNEVGISAALIEELASIIADALVAAFERDAALVAAADC